MSEKKIASVGCAGIDHYIDRNIFQAGGISLNFAIHASRVFPKNYEVTLYSALGNDENGANVSSTLARNKVINQCVILPGKTFQLQLMNDESGEKQFVGYDPGVLHGFVLPSTQKDTLQESTLVMASLFSVTEPLVQSLFALKPLNFLSVDFANLGTFTNPEIVVQKYIPEVDVAFFGLSIDQQELIDYLGVISKIYKKIRVLPS